MGGYVAMATEKYEAMVAFYTALGFKPVRGWDRANGRGQILEAHGLKLEILDATRERFPMRLEPPGDRFHVILEVPDLDAVRGAITQLPTPDPVTTSWGTRILKLRDPDGVRVWFMQWLTDPARVTQ